MASELSHMLNSTSGEAVNRQNLLLPPLTEEDLRHREPLHIVWQYNSEFGLCNYECPYCYYKTGVLKKQVFGDAWKWKDAFKKTFAERELIFYLSFGEPTIGRSFPTLLDTVASEPHWKLHMTSNLSLPLKWWERIVQHDIVKKGKLFINASFHPTEAHIEEFTEKLLLLRRHGIECPVVIVMWPPIVMKFREYYDHFSRYRLLVHVRRFVGWYQGRHYPRAYTDEERHFIAKFMDDATIRYELNYELHLGKESTAGCNYVLCDEFGDMWESPDSRGAFLGNIFRSDVKLYEGARPYSGARCASVQGIASLVELGYGSLDPNFVTNYAKRGGVYRLPDGTVHYKNISTDFLQKAIKKHYNFPTGFRKIKLKVFSLLIDPFYRWMFLKMGKTRMYRLAPLRYFVMFMFAANTYPPANITPGYWDEIYLDSDRTKRYSPRILRNPKALAKIIDFLTPGV